MERRDIIVIGASAGGIEALRKLVAVLPASLPAAILLVVHLSPAGPSALASILGRAGQLPAITAEHDAPIEPGRIYVAPPDRHLLIRDGRIRLSRGARVNSHRPAVDPLFFSAARWGEGRVIGVVLSGGLDDGAAGVAAIRHAGGYAIAQRPEEALASGMPTSAIAAGVDEVADVETIGHRLVVLTRDAVGAKGEPLGSPIEIEQEIEGDPGIEARPVSSASGFVCPDCHGALWELAETGVLRYRCRVGHSFGAESLIAAQGEKIEEAMWSAYRTLEESAAVANRLAERCRGQGLASAANAYEARAADVLVKARSIRDLLVDLGAFDNSKSRGDPQ